MFIFQVQNCTKAFLYKSKGWQLTKFEMNCDLTWKAKKTNINENHSNIWMENVKYPHWTLHRDVRKRLATCWVVLSYGLTNNLKNEEQIQNQM